MFGNPLPAIAAQPAAPHGSGSAPDREKLEPRLSAMLMGQGVQESTLDTLGKVGILTVQVFANLAEKKEEMRKLLERDEIGIKSDSIQGALEQARVLGVWLASQTMLAVEAKHEAERAVTAQAPEISLKELVAQKQLFERSTRGFPLPPAMCPSKAFLERKLLELETCFEAEYLTSVTNRSAEDSNQEYSSKWDAATNSYKSVRKTYTVAMPKTSEQLRARWRTLGLGFVFAHQKFPHKPALSTATTELFDLYTEYMFGPEVWGCATLGENGRPISTPTIKHVLIYDKAIRDRVAELMNANWDIRAAFGEATAHERTRRIHFDNVCAQSINAPECRAISAPGLCDYVSVTDPERSVSTSTRLPAIADGSDGLSKTEKNRLAKAKKRANKAKAKSKAAADAARAAPPKRATPLALQNGGVQDGRGKATKKQLKQKTTGTVGGLAAGLSICYKYGLGKPCNQTPCPHKHICQICEGPHPWKECPSK